LKFGERLSRDWKRPSKTEFLREDCLKGQDLFGGKAILKLTVRGKGIKKRGDLDKFYVTASGLYTD